MPKLASTSSGLNYGLSLQQRMFCENFVSQGIFANKTKAAAAAGYANPGGAANALLVKPNIIEYINQRRKEQAIRNNISMDDIINKWARIAFFDIRTIYNEDGSFKQIHELDDVAAAAIASIEVEEDRDNSDGSIISSRVVNIKLHDSKVALKELAALLGFVNPTWTATVKRDANGQVIHTEETLTTDVNATNRHEVIFTDNSGGYITDSDITEAEILEG